MSSYRKRSTSKIKNINDKKGNISISVIVAILLLSILYMGTSFMKAENSLDSVSEISESTETFVHDINSKERLFSLLSDNKSFVGVANYEDLDRSFNVETIDETFEEIELSASEGQVDFQVDNETEIVIEVEGNNYNIELMYDGEDILNGEGQGLSGDKVITVSKDQIYNHNDNETNYGDYRLYLDGDASGSIKYNNLVERKVLVKGDGFNRSIMINELGIEYED